MAASLQPLGIKAKARMRTTISTPPVSSPPVSSPPVRIPSQTAASRSRAGLRTLVSLSLLLAACAPAQDKPAQAPAPASAPAPAPAAAEVVAPDVAAAMASGAADPRVPTVDPASITDASTVGDIMHAFIIPGSETLFAAETEGAPADEAGWARLRKAAADVIHGAELLKTGARSKGKAWDATLDTVINATRVTAAALAKKNADDLVFTDGDMMAGCTACHQQFRDQKPPEGHLIETKPDG